MIALLAACNLGPALEALGPQPRSGSCGVSLELPGEVQSLGDSCLFFQGARLQAAVAELERSSMERTTARSLAERWSRSVLEGAGKSLTVSRSEPWLVGEHEAWSLWGQADTPVRVVVVETPARFVLVFLEGSDVGQLDEVARSLTVTDPARYDTPQPWHAWEVTQEEGTLLQARKEHTTRLVETVSWPGPPPEPPRDSGLERVQYPSGPHRLWAYRTPDPGDGEKHPVVVWAHGGFGGLGETFFTEQEPRNDQSARAFRDAGIPMVIPSWRGESGNPGQLEMFYGEVDDLLAAVEYARSLPWADEHHVYLAGHSTGGTLVLLASMLGKRHRAAFSFGGQPDMVGLFASGGYTDYAPTPFDTTQRTEALLRSPAHWVGSLQRPTYYFEGEDGIPPSLAWGMEVRAEELGVPFHSFTIAGHDHFDILAPLTALVAEAIADHEGPEHLVFDADELQRRVDGTFLSLEGPPN